MKSIKARLVLIVILMSIVSGALMVGGMQMAYKRNVALFSQYAEQAGGDVAGVSEGLAADVAGNRNRAMGLAVGLAVLQAVVLVSCLNVFVFKRIDLVIHDTTRFIGGDLEAAIPVRNEDEMGQIEGALEEFRVLLLDTMKQVPSNG